MKNRLYVSDLDGTLFNNNAELSEFSREAIKTILDMGANFTIATARSLSSVQPRLRGLNLNLPIIEFNGAFISDLASGEHIFVNEINIEIKKNIFHFIRMADKYPFISTFDGEKDWLFYSKILNPGMDYYKNNREKEQDNRLRHIDSLEQIISQKIICFNVIDRKENLLDLYNKINEEYCEEVQIYLLENESSPGWYWLTIHDKNATKDKAIIKLKSMIDSEIQELIVFGDNDNDIKMFQIADEAIAVENANEKVKKYATKIIGKNQDDSVVKYILHDLEKSK